MITVATLPELSDAYLLRSMLEANGIAAFIPDENTAQTDWNYITAIGGIRVQVPSDLAEKARPILAEFRENLSRETGTDEKMPRSRMFGKLMRAAGILLFAGAVGYAGLYFYLEHQIQAESEGDLASDRGDFVLAIADFTRALNHDSQDPTLYIKRGLAYGWQDEYEKAIGDFTQAIQLNGGLGQAFADRGDAYDDEHKYDLALADYKAALRLNPEDEHTIFNRGNVYAQEGDLDDAIDSYNRALQINPKDAQAYFYRGASSDRKFAHVAAMKDYETAIQLSPKSADSYNMLAWDLATCPDAEFRDGKKAVTYATTACQLSKWNHAELLDTLATADAETGDFDSAVKWERAALAIPGHDPTFDADAKLHLSLYEAHKAYHEKQ